MTINDIYSCGLRLLSGKDYDELLLNYNILHAELTSARSALNTAQKQITELGFKIYNQKREISNLHKKIKELKNGKN